MTALKEHFAHHRLHMIGCGVGCLSVITALIVGVPILAITGALLCGAMMVGMVWMMYAMRSGDH